jgi:hypothetical protein
MPIVTLPASETQMVPSPTHTALPVAAPSARGLAPVAGAALAFLGREVAPRLVDVLATALEHRLTKPATSTITSLSTSPKSPTRTSQGMRRQTRCRGGRTGK